MTFFREGACFQTEAFNYYLASVWPHPMLPRLSLVLCHQCVNSLCHTSLKQYWRCRFTVFFIFSRPWSHIYKLEFKSTLDHALLWILYELFCRGVFNLVLDLESLQYKGRVCFPNEAWTTETEQKGTHLFYSRFWSQFSQCLCKDSKIVMAYSSAAAFNPLTQAPALSPCLPADILAFL